MPRRTLWIFLLLLWAARLAGQDLGNLQIHGFATQGFLYSSANNYLTMPSSHGSLQWTRAVPGTLKGGPVHEVFLPTISAITWRSSILGGARRFSPDKVRCRRNSAQKQHCWTTWKRHRGAIGYVSRVNEKNSVKVLSLTVIHSREEKSAGTSNG
jgi:hypothetical protein